MPLTALMSTALPCQWWETRHSFPAVPATQREWPVWRLEILKVFEGLVFGRATTDDQGEDQAGSDK